MHLSPRRIERRARESTAFAHVVRWGLVGYGLIHVLVAWVAVRVVVGNDRTSSYGALAQLTGTPWGIGALIGLAVGFAGLALWQVVAAAVGYRQCERGRRVVMRAGAATRVVTYAYFAFSTGHLLLTGRGHTGASPRSTSAGVLADPLGRLLLGVVGLVVIGMGIGLVVFGARRSFEEQLDRAAREGQRRTPIVLLGQIGYVAKGSAFVVIGALACWAAASNDPRRVGGLDRSLAHVARAPLGIVAVLAIAVGIACFGVYLLARARHLAPKTLTS